jgi:hypothetical protein
LVARSVGCQHHSKKAKGKRRWQKGAAAIEPERVGSMVVDSVSRIAEAEQGFALVEAARPIAHSFLQAIIDGGRPVQRLEDREERLIGVGVDPGPAHPALVCLAVAGYQRLKLTDVYVEARRSRT